MNVLKWIGYIVLAILGLGVLIGTGAAIFFVVTCVISVLMLFGALMLIASAIKYCWTTRKG